jgi:hypothetical protein
MANTVHEGGSSFLETVEYNELLRVKQQQDRMREGEGILLERATTAAEFREARDTVVVDYDTPLDEVDFQSYRARRAEGEGRE